MPLYQHQPSPHRDSGEEAGPRNKPISEPLAVPMSFSKVGLACAACGPRVPCIPPALVMGRDGMDVDPCAVHVSLDPRSEPIVNHVGAHPQASAGGATFPKPPPRLRKKPAPRVQVPPLAPNSTKSNCEGIDIASGDTNNLRN